MHSVSFSISFPPSLYLSACLPASLLVAEHSLTHGVSGMQSPVPGIAARLLRQAESGVAQIQKLADAAPSAPARLAEEQRPIRTTDERLARTRSEAARLMYAGQDNCWTACVKVQCFADSSAAVQASTGLQGLGHRCVLPVLLTPARPGCTT